MFLAVGDAGLVIPLRLREAEPGATQLVQIGVSKSGFHNRPVLHCDIESLAEQRLPVTATAPGRPALYVERCTLHRVRAQVLSEFARSLGQRDRFVKLQLLQAGTSDGEVRIG